jgi:hypothetical protein
MISPYSWDEQVCFFCGCTDENCSGCVERTGLPCYWVYEDLCSACAEDPTWIQCEGYGLAALEMPISLPGN